jgi:hypothetical protein
LEVGRIEVSILHESPMGEGGRLVSPKLVEGGRPGEGQDFDESLKDQLAAVNRDLATARERLVHYEAQLGRQN